MYIYQSTVLKNGVCPKDVHHGTNLARSEVKRQGEERYMLTVVVLTCLDQ